MKNTRSVGIIPARMAATRFPGKPLALIKGKPMLWHVWRRSTLSSLSEVVIATCDEEIRRACEGFGAKVVMTSDAHTRCNDRVAEAARELDAEIVVNIQGDEPLVHPRLIDDILAEFARRPEVQAINPVAELTDPAELASPNTVKVVYNVDGRVLYFSRFPIPSDAVVKRKVPVYRQVPIMGFRKSFLLELAATPEAPLEVQEGIDLLRAVENDMPIHILKTSFQTIGVDVPADVARVERSLENDPVFAECSR